MEHAVKKMRVIYNRSDEFPDLGLNLYAGCSHDCWYCYKKRDDRQEGPYDIPAKGATLQNIQNDLMELRSSGDIRPVIISVFCDPYDMGRMDDIKPKGLMKYFGEDDQKAISGVSDSFTRTVLKTFRVYEYPFHILTKGGTKAVKDFDLYGPNDQFGVTLTFDNDADSRKWEPGAALPGDRIAALEEAHKQKIRTCVSIEPVIYPDQSMNLIERTNDFVDLFCVGKLNRHPKVTWTVPEEWPTVDWPKFRNDVEALLQKCGKQLGIGYLLDRQLIEAR